MSDTQKADSPHEPIRDQLLYIEGLEAVVRAAKRACEHGYGGVGLVAALRDIDPNWYSRWSATWPDRALNGSSTTEEK